MDNTTQAPMDTPETSTVTTQSGNVPYTYVPPTPPAPPSEHAKAVQQAITESHTIEPPAIRH